MKPNTRSLLFTTAFLPMERTVDNRAQHYLRKLDSITQATNPPAPPAPQRPRWHVAVEALAWWSVAITAALWLAHRYGWIA